MNLTNISKKFIASTWMLAEASKDLKLKMAACCCRYGYESIVDPGLASEINEVRISIIRVINISKRLKNER
jgi:hypothetical protein